MPDQNKPPGAPPPSDVVETAKTPAAVSQVESAPLIPTATSVVGRVSTAGAAEVSALTGTKAASATPGVATVALGGTAPQAGAAGSTVPGATAGGTVTPAPFVAAPQQFVVTGRVTLSDLTPLAGVTVLAFDRDLRPPSPQPGQPLGTPGIVVTTDSDGQYQIQYTSDQFSRAEKGTADLVVQVLSSTNTVLAQSDTHFNLLPGVPVNLTVDSALPGVPSEYDRLLVELEPLLVNVTIAGIDSPTTFDKIADLQAADIDFLVGETEEPRPKLEAIVTGTVLAKQAETEGFGVPVPAFYGLARQGLPLDLIALLSYSDQQLTDTLRAAIAGNIIDNGPGDLVAGWVQSLRGLLVHHALTATPAPGTYGVAAILGAAALSADQQQAVLKLSANQAGTPQDFWAQLRTQPTFQQPGVVEKLQLTLQLGLLTQNHVPLIQQLLASNVSSTRDLVNWDTATWLTHINALPGAQAIGVPLGVPGDTPADQALNYATGMVATLQAAFPTVAMARVAATVKGLPARPAVAQFFANSPEFDIATTKVDRFVADNTEKVFSGIAEADKPIVVTQVKRLQRVFALAPNADSATALLSAGLDSGNAIAQMSEKTFLARYTVALGGEEIARTVHLRARTISAQATHVMMAVREELGGVKIAAIDGASRFSLQTGSSSNATHLSTSGGSAGTGSANSTQNSVSASQSTLVKMLPDYAELFGSLDLCRCCDCRSVLSVAAYLVDLFEFLRNSTPNDQGKTPLDALFARRPDLQHLPLTCENTNVELPYIDLVNEVLESYIALNFTLDASPAYDTGAATTGELNASPQHTNGQAYTTLSQAIFPPLLPFHQPIAVSRAYLENLGTSRYEVIKTFQRRATAETPYGIASEYLKITRDEFCILTKKDFDGSVPPGRNLWEYFGYGGTVGSWTFPAAPMPPGLTPQLLTSTWEHDLGSVPRLMQSLAISFSDLTALVTTEFVNPSYPQGPALDTFKKIPISFGALKQLKTAGFGTADPTLQALVARALGTYQALIDWATANYDSVSSLIVLDSLDGTCDVTVMRFVHLDGSDVTDPEYDKIHRFVRLWRKMGWSIVDVDRALVSLPVLAGTDLTPDVLVQLSNVAQLKSGWNVPDLQVLLSVWAPTINTHGDDALYTKLFLNKAAPNLDPAFAPKADGSVLDGSVLLGDHVPALLSAFRISATDLDTIRTDAGLSAPNAPLTLSNVTTLYRYAAASSLFRLRAADFISLKTLCGVNPFSGPGQTIAFQAFASRVARSAFSLLQLNYVYRHLAAPPADPSPDVSQVRLLAQTLHVGLAQVADDNAVDPAAGTSVDPNGEVTKAKLQVLFDGPTAEQAVGMINGSALYSAPLAALPIGFTIPPLVAKKVSFDATNHLLRFEGAMADAEYAALKSGDPTLQAAVDDLYGQPLLFIQGTFNGFLDLNGVQEALKNLVRAVPSLDANLNPTELDAGGAVTTNQSLAVTTAVATKFSYLLGKLLPYVVQQLSHALVKQTLAEALGLDAAVAQTLLESVLVAQSDSTKKAIADGLSLAGTGLTAQFYASNDLTGAPTPAIGPLALDAPLTLSAGVQSSRFSGLLTAPATGSYAFSISAAAGAAQLWVADAFIPLTQDAPSGLWTATVNLGVAQPAAFRLELTLLPASPGSVALQWQSASTPKAPVPASLFLPQARFDAFATTYTRLQKSALLVNAFELGAAEVTYLSGHAADFSGFDFNALPLARNGGSEAAIDQGAPKLFAAWSRISDYAALRDSLPGGSVTLLDVFGATSAVDAQAKLAQASGWNADVIADLCGSSGLSLTTSAFANEIAITMIQTCVALVQRLGVSAAQLFSWADLDKTFTDLQQTIAPDIQKTTRGKYTQDAWQTIAKSINDPLRQLQRDALVAYLLPHMGLTDADQLFEYFLIDAQMCACMETSRIVQATSAVQVFVQRCLLNLEEVAGSAFSIVPSAIDASQWNDWRCEYRLWQANREVLFFAEDWMDYAIRDDKSPFFKDLESALMQGDLTTDNIQAALLGYLQDVDQIQRLDVVAMYLEDKGPDTGESINTLHVFGRTRENPYLYFYRRRSSSQVWSAWEPIGAGVEGDHLVPVVWNRRLLLFWATFASKVETPDVGTVSQSSSADPPVPYLEIGMAWSEYRAGKWSAKQTTPRGIVIRTPANNPTIGAAIPSDFAIRTAIESASVSKPQLKILLEYRVPNLSTAWPTGVSTTVPELVDFLGTLQMLKPGALSGTAQRFAFGFFVLDSAGVLSAELTSPTEWQSVDDGSTDPRGGTDAMKRDFVANSLALGPQPATYLQQTTPFQILPPHDLSTGVPNAPLFFIDGSRTFFASPATIQTPLEAITDPQAIALHYSGSGSPMFNLNPPSASTGGSAPVTEQTHWAAAAARKQVVQLLVPRLSFDAHYHPFADEFTKTLARSGLWDLFSESTQTLGEPYRHEPWQLAFWGSLTSVSDLATGPASLIQGNVGGLPVMRFEAVVLEGKNLVHYEKDNSATGFSQPWGKGEIITSKATGPACLVLSDRSTKFPAGYDLVVLEGANLVHYSNYLPLQSQWPPGVTVSTKSTGAGTIVLRKRPPDGSLARFEVIALEGKSLVHYSSDDGTPPWPVTATVTTIAASPASAIASTYNGPGGAFLELVVCEDPSASGPPFALVHYTFDGATWTRGETITANATDAGCIIQSNLRNGEHGNFEVVVPEGNALVHYWRDNSLASAFWQQGQVITRRAAGPAAIIQSGFGASNGFRGNFEVLALESVASSTTVPPATRLVHYWKENDIFQFAEVYNPDAKLVVDPYPAENIDFRSSGACSIYNWELFFYAPLLVAKRLLADQRPDEAMKYLRLNLDVTADTPSEQPPSRYWKFLPFKEVPEARLAQMLLKLDQGDPELKNQIADWSQHPFDPFRIARLRWSVFQKWVFKSCMDTEIAIADRYFRQNTREAIALALQHYIIASHMLGRRAIVVPNRGTAAPQSYAQLRASGPLDALSNAMIEIENMFPYTTDIASGASGDSGGLLGVSQSLYFCAPQNDQLSAYWDILADRLFKIRNCMNIEGVVQDLPLFAPPIDPALLVQAKSLGLDISSILSDVYASLPYYRPEHLIAKAIEMCAEVRLLGAALLATLEKKDAEALATLRATQETTIQRLMVQLKTSAYEEAQNQLQALTSAQDAAFERCKYYDQMIHGASSSLTRPDAGAELPILAIPSILATVAASDGISRLLSEEQSELTSTASARDHRVIASTHERLAGSLAIVPDLSSFASPWGVGASTLLTGGTILSNVEKLVAQTYESDAASDSYDAGLSGKMAGYYRREQEWTLQYNLAAHDFSQIAKQLLASNIRLQMADYELNTLLPKQIEHAQAVQDFYASKYTNQELYTWMISDISATYFQCYNAAYECAKKYERSVQFTLGTANSNFITFGYWDSLRKGLQAGERLYLALKQLESAYEDQNRREYEITKRISLLLLDPTAVIALKTTGQCVIDLPEALFDADYPGHYMRRIKSVSLTIPCVTGPYTSVNCTLTLLKSKIRRSSSVAPAYAEQDDDARFAYNFSGTQSIATSTAENDSGMFEVSFRDERYLPFEGLGVVSRWRLEMPPENNAFDMQTITEPIFTVLYTSRDGGDPLRSAARKLAAAQSQGMSGARAFSLRHEFPNEWYKLLNPADATAPQAVTLPLTQDRFPFFLRGRTLSIDQVDMFLIFKDVYDASVYTAKPPTPLATYATGSPLTLQATPPGAAVLSTNLVADSLFHGAPHASAGLTQPASVGNWQIEFDADAIAAPLKAIVSGTPHFRLNTDVVADLVLVVQYASA